MVPVSISCPPLKSRAASWALNSLRSAWPADSALRPRRTDSQYAGLPVEGPMALLGSKG